MLVLTRKRDEEIIVDNNIVIKVLDIRGDKVSLGIEAPQHIPVHRGEVQRAIERERNEAKTKTAATHS